MIKESSNNHSKNTFSETTNIANENIICKDGFCSLPNQKEISKQDENNKRSVYRLEGSPNLGVTLYKSSTTHTSRQIK